MTDEEWWQGRWKLTEAKWQACTSPDLMLRFLRGRASDRKIRMFACHCCRRVWQYLVDVRSRHAIEVVEQFADGLTSEEELLAAHSDAVAARGATSVDPASIEWTDASLDHYDPDMIASYATASCSSPLVFPPGRSWSGCYAALHVEEYVSRALAFAASKGISDGNKTHNAIEEAEQYTQCQWLRDIFGNPFRPVMFSPEWRTDTALALARQMYECRDFSAMPILADALQDAGCDNDDILNHCRQPGEHVRGCWVVDLVLGKK